MLVAQPATEKIYHGINLDEVMVKEVRKGFDVDAFIWRIKKDTTFYKAFKTLRLHSFTMHNDIEIFDKKEQVKASCQSITKQIIKQHCRSMQVIQEKVYGDFYDKKKDYNYYTAKLYAHLFFTAGVMCNEHNIVAGSVQKGSAKYEEQLRNLIFNPGQKIYGIPGIGDNVAIFEPPYRDKYIFKLSKTYFFQDSCYVFTALPQQSFQHQVVINELKTWFKSSDFSIIAREYALSFKTLFYDFDVQMKVKLKKIHPNDMVPYEISYKGNWHIFSKPREIASFTAIFTDFL